MYDEFSNPSKIGRGYLTDELGAEGVISQNDSYFPRILKEIQLAPQKLYYRGNLSLLGANCISIVGTRKPSEYGRRVAFNLARKLACEGFVIVSGLAYGIDCEAHRGAISAGGFTIAVMGNGIDSYPASTRKIRNEIAKSHLIISEYPDGTHGTKYSFPIRNRIISGLSMATVVVEAGLSSGSLITAERAGEQGRIVYAVPGNIDNVNSIGTNKLIMDGAIPLYALDNVASELYEMCPNMKPENMKFKHKNKIQVDNSRSDNEDRRGIENDVKSNDIKDMDYAILEHIKKQGEQSIYALAEYFNMNVKDMSVRITILEMHGFVYSAVGKVFIAKF